jgi:hypothetical protein
MKPAGLLPADDKITLGLLDLLLLEAALAASNETWIRVTNPSCRNCAQ